MFIYQVGIVYCEEKQVISEKIEVRNSSKLIPTCYLRAAVCVTAIARTATRTGFAWSRGSDVSRRVYFWHLGGEIIQCISCMHESYLYIYILYPTDTRSKSTDWYVLILIVRVYCWCDTYFRVGNEINTKTTTYYDSNIYGITSCCSVRIKCVYYIQRKSNVLHYSNSSCVHLIHTAASCSSSSSIKLVVISYIYQGKAYVTGTVYYQVFYVSVRRYQARAGVMASLVFPLILSWVLLQLNC